MKTANKRIQPLAIAILLFVFTVLFIVGAVNLVTAHSGYDDNQVETDKYAETESPANYVYSQDNFEENSYAISENLAYYSNYSQLLEEMQTAIDALSEEVNKLQQTNMIFSAGVFFESGVNDDSSARQLRQNEINERFLYRVEYYNAIALRLRIELMNRNVTLAQRQFEIERVRLYLGETTQGNVDFAYVQMHAVADQRQLIEDSFLLRVEVINRKRGVFGFEFITDYTLPPTSSPYASDLSSLTTGLLNNNISLEIITQQIDEHNAVLADLIETNADAEIIERLQTEINNLSIEQGFIRGRLEMVATIRWIAYLDAKMQSDLAMTMRPILIANLDLIGELYVLGEISYLEKLTYELEVYEELFNAYMAEIALAIAIAEINTLMLGVVA
ncbi:MAG: hypothetical protein FWC13_09940 [Oscillospiraceae bacterium]|nr:hypothetical protein [Oscillospiraceae bacterium]